MLLLLWGPLAQERSRAQSKSRSPDHRPFEDKVDLWEECESSKSLMTSQAPAIEALRRAVLSEQRNLRRLIHNNLIRQYHTN